MSNIIEKYVKKKEYLVCVDSDGCETFSLLWSMYDPGVEA